MEPGFNNRWMKVGMGHITHMAKYVTGYGMKGLKRPTFSMDNILVLPRTLGELPDRKHRSPGVG
jgi:hypothetical protein